MAELAFCTIAFRDDPIEDVLPKTAAIGYDAAEVFWGQLDGKSDDELKAVRELTDEAGMPILVIAPYLSFTRDKAEYEASVQRAAAVVNAAKILGARKIRTFTDVGPTGVASAKATDEQWKMGIEGLKTITAMDRDLTFVLEQHGDTLADTPESIRRVLAETDAPNLKLLLHPNPGGAFGGVDGYKAFADVVDHLHVKNKAADGEPAWVEQGVDDVAGYLGEILDAGYSGSVSVEYCWRGATWNEAKTAYEYLAPVFKR